MKIKEIICEAEAAEPQTSFLQNVAIGAAQQAGNKNLANVFANRNLDQDDKQTGADGQQKQSVKDQHPYAKLQYVSGDPDGVYIKDATDLANTSAPALYRFYKTGGVEVWAKYPANTPIPVPPTTPAPDDKNRWLANTPQFKTLEQLYSELGGR